VRIAQVAPLYESVPPKYYGGTERVVSYLTEELVKQGHDVTLFASGDSVTTARLIAPCEASLRLDTECIDQLSHHILMIEQVMQRVCQFDVTHFHIDYLHYPISRRQRVPQVTTLHGRLDIPDLAPLYREFRDMPVVSISNAQRTPVPGANWQGTVYHGLPDELYTFRADAGDYLAFVGRISPEKQVDHAIEIARRAGMNIRIAAKVDPANARYFEETIKPLLDQPHVEYIGEIGERDKNEFLGKAYALVFPIEWPEPFGLVMIEAMACGTPVVAYRRGSVDEVMVDGKTGFTCDGMEDAVAAIPRIAQIDRRECRRIFDERFTVRRMAQDYVAIYEQLLVGHLKVALTG
jgi:glycosyltransferase involved in cell wall biosynthesis